MPGTFTRDDVERVAELARLALSGGDVDLFARQLAAILAYAEQIQSVQTDGIPEFSHAPSTSQAWRPDAVQPSLPREDALAGAPAKDAAAGLFKVPRVLG